MLKVYCTIVAMSLCLLFSSCTRMGEYVAPAPVYELSPSLKPGDSAIVHKGDTLYSIAWSYGIDYSDIAAINDLHAPYTLAVGQKLALTPKQMPITPPTRSVKNVRPAQPHTTVIASPVKQGSYTSAKTQNDSRKNSLKKTKKSQRAEQWHWQWPLHTAAILKSKQSVGRRGIDLITRKGTPVYTAGPGVVVYTGTGVKGYGQLVIVKHSQDYLTAYGFNEKIIVHDGQSVAVGQVIAYAGLANNGEPTVHFELRKNGKSVNPFEFLPKKKA